MMASAGDNAATAGLADELGTLARQIVGIPGLRCNICSHAESWSFHWVEQRITMPASDLRWLPADECRALVVHEAGHAALTRIHLVVPVAQQRTHALLLNVFEDTRLETWLMRESADFAAWLRAVNDRLYADDGQPTPSLCHAFANECLGRWWFGEDHGAAVPAMVAEALHTTRHARQRLTTCLPTSKGFSISHGELLRCQRAFWDIVRSEILPHWERLVAEDRRLGNPPLSAAGIPHIAGIIPTSAAHLRSADGCMTRIAVQGSAATTGENTSSGSTTTNADPGATASGPSAALHHSRQQQLTAHMGEAWAQAWIATAHRSLALATLLRRLHAPQGSQLSPPGLTGSHLYWPSVVASQADPRHRLRLWQRRTPIVPQHQPAVWLLVDRSGSMRGEAMTAAWQGMVLCAETCERAGIPWGMSVFNNRHHILHHPGDILNHAHRRWMGAHGAAAEGETNLPQALEQVRGRLHSVSDGTRLVIVLTDARLSRRSLPHLHRCINDAETAGDTVVALLLNSPPQSMRDGFPRHQCINNPTDIPEHLALLLRDQLR